VVGEEFAHVPQAAVLARKHPYERVNDSVHHAKQGIGRSKSSKIPL
jgi:hypothetical protein